MQVREIHNVTVSTIKEGGMLGYRDKENHIIIINYALQRILPTQLNKIYVSYKVMCECKCCISDKSIKFYLLSCRDSYLNKLKYQSQNYHNRKSGELESRIYDTYEIYVMTHGHHIHKTSPDMEIAIICDFPSDQHDTPHCKCVLHFC